MNPRCSMRRSLAIALLCLAFAASIQAQFRAGLQGVVTDPTGALVPAAKITLTNQETGIVRDAASSEAGFYRFNALPPGLYTVRVEKEGFKAIERRDVTIRAEQLEGADFELETGAISESVTVSASTEPLLSTEESSVSRTLGRDEIEHLPQMNRDPYELVRLAPGVFGDGSRNGGGNSVGMPNTTGPGGSNLSIYQTENQVPISANGQRLSNNVFTVDGVSVNSLNWGGAALVTPNQESVKEVRVNANNYSAEYGRNSGVQVEVLSQSGTNQYHGSALFKFNQPELNAYNKYGGVNAFPTRVENKFRQYAASFGGPIIKNSLFFFFSYEGMRNNSNNLTTTWLETPQYRQLVASARPGSIAAQILGASGMEPRVANVLSANCPGSYTAATCRVVNGGIDLGSPIFGTGVYVDPSDGRQPIGGGFDGIPDAQFVQIQNPNEQRGNQFNPRVDYTRGNDNFAFSAYITPFRSTAADTAGGSRPIGDFTRDPLNSAYTLTWNRVISPTMINAARFNFTRFNDNQLSANADANYQLPRIEIEGLQTPDRIRFGAPQGEFTPAQFAQNIFEYNDVFTKVFSSHTLKGGVIYRREQDNSAAAGGARPLYTFTGMWNFANDTPIYESINADPATGLPADGRRYFRDSYVSFFVQDDWKATPDLTLNFGLRWEYFSPLTETRGRLSNFFFGDNLLADAQVRPVDELTNPDRNNFGPRFGFAYNPKILSKKLVFRGGGGVFFNRVPTAVFGNSRGNPPFFGRYGICCGTASTWFGTPYANGQILYATGQSESLFSYPINPALANGIDPVTGGPRGVATEIYMAQQDTPNPYVYIWSADVQYELPFQMVADVGYQGSAGHKLIRLVNQNFLYQNNPAFFAIYNPQPDVNSNFNALLLSLNKRFSHGVQFAANYRWSKSIDTLSYEGPGAVTNQTYPFDQSTERGPSDFDVRHFFTLTAVYDLPFFQAQEGVSGKLLGGWSISTIYSKRTGFPWTPVTGQSVSTPGGPSLGPTRPIAYYGGALNDSSDDAFIRPNGNFPNGGTTYFDISQGGFPGIGRNSFRGPQYDTLDLSFLKRTSLTALPFLGEDARLELRANLYNVFNQLNLAPFNFGSSSTRIEDTQFFGRSAGGLAGRVVEFQARFSF